MTYQSFTDHFNNAPITPLKDVEKDDTYFTAVAVPATETTEESSAVNSHISNLRQEERYYGSSDNLLVGL